MSAQSKSYSSGSVCVNFVTETDENGKQIVSCKSYGDPDTVSYEFTQAFLAVFSARAAYQIDAHWNAALNVNNLFDKVYYQTVGDSTSGNWYGEPRNSC